MIPLMKNTFLHEYETKRALADFIVKTSRLSMDSNCINFENEFAHYQKRKHAVLFNSGGSANLALFQSLVNLGILKQNDKIGFSALTWSTNTMPIIQMNMKPVPIDCDPKTLNVMSSTLEQRLQSEKIQAFFITNALGFLGDLQNIKKICEENDILLLEDNCESLGSELPSGKAGNFGFASTFSFFVAHHMSTIEGGMVCTDDENLSLMLRMVRANGWDRNLTSEQQFSLRAKHHVNNEFDAKYIFYDLGYNLRPTEITGFLGHYQLQFIEENISKREENYMLLEKIVQDNPELIPIDHSHMLRVSNFAFPILCKTPELRNKYFFQFSGAGIEIRPMIAGNIQKQPFYIKYVKRKFDLPGTDFIHYNGFYCGNYPELSHIDLETISSCLKFK